MDSSPQAFTHSWSDHSSMSSQSHPPLDQKPPFFDIGYSQQTNINHSSILAALAAGASGQIAMGMMPSMTMPLMQYNPGAPQSAVPFGQPGSSVVSGPASLLMQQMNAQSGAFLVNQNPRPEGAVQQFVAAQHERSSSSVSSSHNPAANNDPSKQCGNCGAQCSSPRHSVPHHSANAHHREIAATILAEHSHHIRTKSLPVPAPKPTSSKNRGADGADDPMDDQNDNESMDSDGGDNGDSKSDSDHSRQGLQPFQFSNLNYTSIQRLTMSALH